jgi:F-type H+-transporting ATPase subunit b
MMEILTTDTGIWVLFSFLIFCFVAYRLGRKSVTSSLDGYIEEIRTEIDNAERLRVEAQELLAQYQRKQRDAEDEAEKILQHAKAQAEQSKKNADTELQETMARREEQLAERLRRLEENAVAEIQNHAAQLAVEATREMILQTMDQQKNAELNNRALQKLPEHLN